MNSRDIIVFLLVLGAFYLVLNLAAKIGYSQGYAHGKRAGMAVGRRLERDELTGRK